MRKSVFAITVILSCAVLTSAQTSENNNKSANKSSAVESTQQAQTATQSPELVEANRLSVSVVEKYQAGKFDEALPMARRALELREKELAPDHPLTVSALRNLGEVYFAKGKYGEAIPLFQRALAINEKKLGADNLQLCELLDKLAILSALDHKPEKAVSFFQRELAIKEQAPAAMHADVAKTAYDLAEFYQLIGEYKKAEPLYQRLVEIREKTAKEPAKIAEALERYACSIRKLNRKEEADQLQARAFQLRHQNDEMDATHSSPPIKGGVLNGRALELPRPVYPEEVRAAHIQGAVVVQITISEEGKVMRACAVEGPFQLMRTSELAALGSTFSPTTLDGKPVKVTGVIRYDFKGR